MINSEGNDNPELIKDRLLKLFKKLSARAFHGPFKAHGQCRIINNKRLHGTVECTRDLSKRNCKKCFDIAISELIDRSYKIKGRRAIYESCFIRFESYQFYY